MTDKQQLDAINEYLENCYSGAKMMDNDEFQVRIARAIASFNADIELEIFNEEFLKII